MTDMGLLVGLIILGYLCGSICSAIVVSRLFGLPDPRTEGSKNPGATNILRLAGKKFAAIVLIGDMVKGLFPVLIAQVFHASPFIMACTALAAVIGHMYPLFFSFEGGKGVATALGGLLGLHFMMGVELIILWLLIANFSRYSSLASIVTMLIAPVLMLVFFHSEEAVTPILFITFFILYKHNLNIQRLFNGTEPKIKFSRNSMGEMGEDILSETIILEDEEKTVEIPVVKKTVIKKSAPSNTAKVIKKTPVKKETKPTIVKTEEKPVVPKKPKAKKPAVKKPKTE